MTLGSSTMYKMGYSEWFIHYRPIGYGGTMKIRVINEEYRFTIPLPNWLLLNPVTAALCVATGASFTFINRHIPEDVIQISMANRLSYGGLIRLFREIKKCRRYLHGEPLVSVHSGDGDVVEIYL